MTLCVISFSLSSCFPSDPTFTDAPMLTGDPTRVLRTLDARPRGQADAVHLNFLYTLICRSGANEAASPNPKPIKPTTAASPHCQATG